MSEKRARPDGEGANDGGNLWKVNDEGERYLELNTKRRVTVRTFKGMKLIDIRKDF